jgi:hypothetical protein
MFRSVARWLAGPSNRTTDRREKRTARLGVEGLEVRDVPAAVFVVAQGAATDSTHFATLAGALAAAGNGGTVTVEPGAAPDSGAVSVTEAGVTIKADTTSLSAYFTPLYNLNVNAGNVTLSDLNLQTVTLASGYGGLQLLNSTVNTLAQAPGTVGAPGNVIEYDRILGSVTLVGTAGSSAGDTVEYNVFTGSGAEGGLGSATAMLTLDDVGNVSVLDNDFGNAGTFGPGGALGQHGGGSSDARAQAILGPPAGTAATIGAISITGTAAGALTGVVVEGNTITLQAPGTSTAGIAVTTSTAAAGVTVLNNSITTGAGTGLSIAAGSDAATAVLVQGNDFTGNAVGVSYAGAGGAAIGSDLGGGPLGGTGGNVFASFTAAATAGGAAISVTGVGTGAVLSAQGNVFGTGTPSSVVNGSGFVNVGNALTGNAGYVQYLYVSILGRAGSSAELQGWVNALTSGRLSRSQVAGDVLNSIEALDRQVNQLYIDCLGRAGGTAELTSWAADIQHGLTLEQVITGIVTSTEWQQKNPGSPIEVYYENQLHRTAAASELAGWQTVLQSGGLAAVPTGIVSSPEFRQDFALTVLTQMLHNPSAAAQARSLAANSSLNLLQIEAGLFNSDAYPTA